MDFIGKYLNADCMNPETGLPSFQDNHFDLAIVDPPYGINASKMSMGSAPNRKGKGQYPSTSTAVKIKKGRLNGGSGKLKNRALNKMNCNWDYQIPTQEYFTQLFRVSRNQIIWGGNYFNLPPTRGIAAWNKLQPWENFSQFELAWTSFDVPAKLFTYANTGGANREKKIHPTQKPLALYQWILKKFAKPGQLILDTHVGSASSLIAYEIGGFCYVGYEIDIPYYQDSVARMEKELAPLKNPDLMSEPIVDDTDYSKIGMFKTISSNQKNKGES